MESIWISPALNGFDWYTWVILPAIIFIARIADVTLGTLRIILVSRGKRNIAPILGFFEVLIWITAIAQLVQNIHNVSSYFAYAAGFAVGNFVGIYIEGKLAFGKVIVRVILNKGGLEVADKLRQAGFGATCFKGQGAVSPVMSVFTILNRKDLSKVTSIIHQVAPKAFLSVEDVRSTEEGVFPFKSYFGKAGLLWRKTK